MTRARLVASAALVLFVAVCVANAWVVDDAYITLRTADNFLHGHGLRWNTFERVQTYTHPLWMMLMTVVYAVTREHYFTLLALGWGTTAATLWYVFKTTQAAASQRSLLACACWLVLLVSSKAFVDYSTSGLENPLSHALFALFYFILIRSPQRLPLLTLIASLAFLNRQDTVLLYLPTLVVLTVRSAFAPRAGVAPPATLRKQLGWQLLACSPAWLWEVFSLVYYGFPLPNTAYAKALNGIGPAFAMAQGSRYLKNSLALDPITLVTVAGAVVSTTWLAVKRKNGLRLWPMLGCVLYLFYVWRVGAAGTHMSGRFLTLTFFAATLVALDALREQGPRLLGATLAALLVYQVSTYDSPLRTLGCNWATQPRDSMTWRGVLDTRRYVCAQGAALANGLTAKRPLPDHDWFYLGLQARRDSQHELLVNVGGADGWGAIGYYGYAAGPRVRIIDRLALGDPLLARLPVREDWSRIAGHYERLIPDGYVETVRSGQNHIVDPEVRALYSDIMLVTQAPLFAAGRFDAIVRLNATH